jgi:hypothetical protein
VYPSGTFLILLGGCVGGVEDEVAGVSEGDENEASMAWRKGRKSPAAGTGAFFSSLDVFSERGGFGGWVSELKDEREVGVIARQTVFERFFGKDSRVLIIWKSLRFD